MMLNKFLQRRKYEVLLFALLQHLFTGALMQNMVLYRDVWWPINMIILGVASIGVFVQKGFWKNGLRNLLFIAVVALPIGLKVTHNMAAYFFVLNIVYFFFFAFIFYEVLRYLIKPSYINTDIISASACGYFLLIEMVVFLMQFLFYQNFNAFKGIDTSGNSQIFIDLVYFCSITLTSIGFGDITPNTAQTKLVTSFFGIAGQFYSVVLVGILISKFVSNSDK